MVRKSLCYMSGHLTWQKLCSLRVWERKLLKFFPAEGLYAQHADVQYRKISSIRMKLVQNLLTDRVRATTIQAVDVNI